jgi:hypothetical protein
MSDARLNLQKDHEFTRLQKETSPKGENADGA